MQQRISHYLKQLQLSDTKKQLSYIGMAATHSIKRIIFGGLPRVTKPFAPDLILPTSFAWMPFPLLTQWSQGDSLWPDKRRGKSSVLVMNESSHYVQAKSSFHIIVLIVEKPQRWRQGSEQCIWPLMRWMSKTWTSEAKKSGEKAHEFSPQCIWHMQILIVHTNAPLRAWVREEEAARSSCDF